MLRIFSDRWRDVLKFTAINMISCEEQILSFSPLKPKHSYISKTCEAGIKWIETKKH